MEHQQIDTHESQTSMNLLTSLLSLYSMIGGFISVNFSEKLKEVDLLLTPLVKLTSLAAFAVTLILNWDKLKSWWKKFSNNISKK